MSEYDQNGFEPLKCSECQRPNNPAAVRCLWCGISLVENATAGNCVIMQVELEYLGGIERLDNPGLVRMIIRDEGVEIREVMPGSRIVNIPAEAILEARVISNVDKVRVAAGDSWWRKLLFDKETREKHARTEEAILRDYVVTIRYRAGDKFFSAAFRRDDQTASATVNSVVRAINSLLKWKTAPVK